MVFVIELFMWSWNIRAFLNGDVSFVNCHVWYDSCNMSHDEGNIWLVTVHLSRVTKTCYISLIICYVSHITFHWSNITCHTSLVTYLFFSIFISFHHISYHLFYSVHYRVTLNSLCNMRSNPDYDSRLRHAILVLKITLACHLKTPQWVCIYISIRSCYGDTS